MNRLPKEPLICSAAHRRVRMAEAFLRLDTHAQLNLLQSNDYHIKYFSCFQYMKDTFLK